MESYVGVDLDAICVIDESIGLVVLKLMGDDLVACEVGWILRNVIAGNLIPAKELQAEGSINNTFQIFFLLDL